MEQTVENPKKYTLIGLGIVSLVVILSFVIYLLSTDTTITSERSVYKVPEWVRANAGWWSEGHISDSEFSSSIQWLLDHGFIKIESCVGKCITDFE